MGDKSKIEWCDATWNPIVGCSRVSAGCENCYAEKLAYRFKHITKFENVVCEDKPKWNNSVFFDDKALEIPLRWKKPRRIFVCSMGDLFHKNVPDEWIDKVFAIMALCPQHTFMVLTKRPERMREYLLRSSLPDDIANVGEKILPAANLDYYRKFNYSEFESIHEYLQLAWYDKFKNIWLGVSVEDQDSAVDRIPYLLDTPAVVRFISAEPLLGPIDLTNILFARTETSEDWGSAIFDCDDDQDPNDPITYLDWVIAGGESGKTARAMHPDWVRKLRDDCEIANVPFFFKQWGEWADVEQFDSTHDSLYFWDKSRYGQFRFKAVVIDNLGKKHRSADEAARNAPPTAYLQNCGKKVAGNLLDGKQHLEFPKIGGV